MSPLFSEIERQAKRLTPQEKVALARILIDDLDQTTDTDVEHLWIAESQRRFEAYRQGESPAVTGDEVMARVRNRLR